MATRRTTTRKTAKTPVKKTRTRKNETTVSEVISSQVNGSRIERLKKLAVAKKIIVPLVIVVIVGLVIYLAMTKLVIAWVDQRPIWWFQYYSDLNSKYGDNLKQQLISEQLIEDEAQNRHVSASQQEINSQLQTIISQEGGQSNLDSVLAQQGLSMDELKHQIKLQILVNKMFGQNVTVSDAEINQYIQDNKSQFPDVNDTIKGQVKDQLKQQKIINAFQAWLAQTEQSNRIIKTQ